MTESDALIVGGGFYGCRIAQHLAARGASEPAVVAAIERVLRAAGR